MIIARWTKMQGGFKASLFGPRLVGEEGLVVICSTRGVFLSGYAASTRL